MLGIYGVGWEMAAGAIVSDRPLRISALGRPILWSRPSEGESLTVE